MLDFNILNSIFVKQLTQNNMENLTRSQIIAFNNDAQKSILFESMHPYLKSLYVFYKDLFCCEPVLMVTNVFNAAQYVKIVSSNEFQEAACDYIGCEVYEIQNDDNFLSQFENINFNSKLLKDII
jgi:hypothetical protein